MKIALIYDPESAHGPVWNDLLIGGGHQVTVIKDQSNVKDVKSNDFDIAIPLITIKDHINRPNPRIDALEELEVLGVEVLTSMASIAASSDKLMTYEIWNKDNIRQPITYLYNDAENNSFKNMFPVIVKPRFGHSGKKICLARVLEEVHIAVKQINGAALIQEYISQPKCLRLIATDQQVICAYEKILNGSVVVNVDTGAIRKYFEPSKVLVDFALGAIKALGGGLMGIDILEKDGKYFALEANVPFGFDENNNELKSRLLQVINDFQIKRLS